MRPLAGYVRVSFVGKRKGDSFRSPEDQAKEIQGWGGIHGHNVELLPPELDGKGDNPDRPTFRQAIEGIKSGIYSGLVVAYLSRAGRDLELMIQMRKEVKAAGGKFYSARENLDASTSAGEMHMDILASIAAAELRDRREGFEKATESATERGIWQARQMPLGYNKDGNKEAGTRKLIPNDRAGEIREIFNDYVDGKPVVQIGREHGMTGGGIRHVLRNRVYLGELRKRSYVKKDAHQPLIDLATFEAVQAKLKATSRAPKKHDGPALLAGLVRCSSCGHVMTRGSGGRGEFFYKCPTHHSGQECPKPVSIKTTILDQYVEPIVLAELSRLQVSASEAADHLAELKDDLLKSERERETYVTTISIEDVGAEAFKAGAKARTDAVDKARAALQAEIARQPGRPITGDVGAIWEDSNAHDKNTLLRGLLSAVVVRPAGRGRKPPMEWRVRVLPFGTDFPLPVKRAEQPIGIVPLGFDDLDRVGVLGVPAVQNAL